MRILVCDDQRGICNQLVRLLMKYAEERRVTIEVDSFYSGIEAYGSLCRKEYDLLFLEIKMKGLDGVKLGKRIREEHKDHFTQIIYFSADTEYVMELFRIKPFVFLIKPISSMILFDVLDRFREIQGGMDNFYSYKKGGSFHHCKLNNILYFESFGKKTILHMVEGSDEYYESLKNIYEAMKLHRFFYCHKSLLVKYDSVQAFYSDYLILVNEERLEISQGKRKEVRELVKKWGMG